MMSSFEEEEGDMDLSNNTEEMLVQSRMTTLMKSLVSSTFGTLSAEDSIGQLLLKEPSQKPESELVHQAWEEGMGIRICLRILEQVVTNWVSDVCSSLCRHLTIALTNSRLVLRCFRPTGYKIDLFNVSSPNSTMLFNFKLHVLT